jgi:hypothetical protein
VSATLCSRFITAPRLFACHTDTPGVPSGPCRRHGPPGRFLRRVDGQISSGLQGMSCSYRLDSRPLPHHSNSDSRRSGCHEGSSCRWLVEQDLPVHGRVEVSPCRGESGRPGSQPPLAFCLAGQAGCQRGGQQRSQHRRTSPRPRRRYPRRDRVPGHVAWLPGCAALTATSYSGRVADAPDGSEA